MDTLDISVIDSAIESINIRWSDLKSFNPLNKEMIMGEAKRYTEAKEQFIEHFSKTPTFQKKEVESSIQNQSINELERKKSELETKKDSIEDEAWDRGFDIEFVNRRKRQIDSDIQNIQSQIDTLVESSSVEEYLNRLPEILQNLHELSSNVLSNAVYTSWRNDLKQLIELTTHELILNDKKELKVKLFDALEKLETFEM
jgi:hypothetical protein